MPVFPVIFCCIFRRDGRDGLCLPSCWTLIGWRWRPLMDLDWNVWTLLLLFCSVETGQTWTMKTACLRARARRAASLYNKLRARAGFPLLFLLLCWWYTGISAPRPRYGGSSSNTATFPAEKLLPFASVASIVVCAPKAGYAYSNLFAVPTTVLMPAFFALRLVLLMILLPPVTCYWLTYYVTLFIDTILLILLLLPFRAIWLNCSPICSQFEDYVQWYSTNRY